MIVPRIETGRLVLRPPVAEDVDAIVAIIRDEAVVRWLARVPWPYERDHAVAWVQGAAVAAAAGDEASFAIDHDDRLIGMVGLRDLASAPHIGYWLGRQWWGRGLMTEAVAAVLDFACGTLGTDAIVSGVFEGNDASLAIQKRFGFVVTGESRVDSVFHGRALRHIDTRLSRDAYLGRTA